MTKSELSNGRREEEAGPVQGSWGRKQLAETGPGEPWCRGKGRQGGAHGQDMGGDQVTQPLSGLASSGKAQE